jgi:hypothetical protein
MVCFCNKLATEFLIEECNAVQFKSWNPQLKFTMKLLKKISPTYNPSKTTVTPIALSLQKLANFHKNTYITFLSSPNTKHFNYIQPTELIQHWMQHVMNFTKKTIPPPNVSHHEPPTFTQAHTFTQ